MLYVWKNKNDNFFDPLNWEVNGKAVGSPPGVNDDVSIPKGSVVKFKRDGVRSLTCKSLDISMDCQIDVQFFSLTVEEFVCRSFIDTNKTDLFISNKLETVNNTFREIVFTGKQSNIKVLDESFGVKLADTITVTGDVFLDGNINPNQLFLNDVNFITGEWYIPVGLYNSLSEEDKYFLEGTKAKILYTGSNDSDYHVDATNSSLLHVFMGVNSDGLDVNVRYVLGSGFSDDVSFLFDGCYFITNNDLVVDSLEINNTRPDVWLNTEINHNISFKNLKIDSKTVVLMDNGKKLTNRLGDVNNIYVNTVDGRSDLIFYIDGGEVNINTYSIVGSFDIKNCRVFSDDLVCHNLILNDLHDHIFGNVSTDIFNIKYSLFGFLNIKKLLVSTILNIENVVISDVNIEQFDDNNCNKFYINVITNNDMFYHNNVMVDDNVFVSSYLEGNVINLTWDYKPNDMDEPNSDSIVLIRGSNINFKDLDGVVNCKTLLTSCRKLNLYDKIVYSFLQIDDLGLTNFEDKTLLVMKGVRNKKFKNCSIVSNQYPIINSDDDREDNKIVLENCHFENENFIYGNSKISNFTSGHYSFNFNTNTKDFFDGAIFTSNFDVTFGGVAGSEPSVYNCNVVYKSKGGFPGLGVDDVVGFTGTVNGDLKFDLMGLDRFKHKIEGVECNNLIIENSRSLYRLQEVFLIGLVTGDFKVNVNDKDYVYINKTMDVLIKGDFMLDKHVVVKVNENKFILDVDGNSDLNVIENVDKIVLSGGLFNFDRLVANKFKVCENANFNYYKTDIDSREIVIIKNDDLHTNTFEKPMRKTDVGDSNFIFDKLVISGGEFNANSAWGIDGNMALAVDTELGNSKSVNISYAKNSIDSGDNENWVFSNLGELGEPIPNKVVSWYKDIKVTCNSVDGMRVSVGNIEVDGSDVVCEEGFIRFPVPMSLTKGEYHEINVDLYGEQYRELMKLLDNFLE